MAWPTLLPRIAPRAQLTSLVGGYAGLTPTVGAAAGATRPGATMPPGYDHSEVTVELPRESFESAAAAVLCLAVHRGSGLLTSQSTPVGEGQAVLVGVPLGPFALVVPCRVSWLSDRGDERGFGYATLPGHPEAGEEAFVVSRDDTGTVTFTVRVFSRPAGLSRLAAPIVRLAARRTVGRYLAAMRELTA